VEYHTILVRNPDGSVVKVGIMPEVVAAARTLPHAPDRYFLIEGATLIPVSDLVLSRARPEGIAHAVKLMSAAYRGEQSRRAPIKVQRCLDDTYLVLDGNSTTIIAMAAGWPVLPCAIVSSGQLEAPASRQALL
jgi:hypothetical protein